jgi:hypothetical protein
MRMADFFYVFLLILTGPSGGYQTRKQRQRSNVPGSPGAAVFWLHWLRPGRTKIWRNISRNWTKIAAVL